MTTRWLPATLLTACVICFALVLAYGVSADTPTSGASAPTPAPSFTQAAVVSPSLSVTTTVVPQQSPASSPQPQQSSGALTARMLEAPNALVGPTASSFNWSPAGATLAYVEPKDGKDILWVYDASSEAKRALFDPTANSDQIDLTSALWSPKSDALLLAGTKSLWLLDVKTGKLKALATGDAPKTAMMYSPTGTYVSYVQNNDLYIVNTTSGKIRRLTTDGSATVFNGGLDWVYNEELATRSAQPAYAWSPDGTHLIYLRLDESAVQTHSVTDYRPLPPTISYTRYPATGTANPKASLRVINLLSGRRSQVALPAGAEYVLPYFSWFPDSKEAVYITVSRDHSTMELRAWSSLTGASRSLVKETDPAWINEDRYAAPIFLSGGAQFLWLSERSGYMHLYLYSRAGVLVKQVTLGDWMIDSNVWNMLNAGRPVQVDPSGGWAYFSSTKNSPLQRQIYRVNIASSQLAQLTQDEGFHLFALSGDGRYLIDRFSSVATPPLTRIVAADGSGAKVLSQTAGPALALPKLTREFVTLKAHDGVPLYAQLVKPEGFNAARKYPVVIHWYGGPGLQTVTNQYGTTNIFNIIERDVLYTQAGFLVWRLDNRGSFGRGHGFETPIALELGKAALDDQLAGVEYLRTLPYVDADRIGSDGKSFGGYMTLYTLVNAPNVLKCGVAGAPPTNWSYYDTIYTERYMRTPAQNPTGYGATDLIAAAGKIKARPLLIHGLADRNVHLQNTVNFIQALMAVDKPFDFLPLPNLDHSFKGDGLVNALSASVDYFTRCFAAPAAAATGAAPTAAPGVAPAANVTPAASPSPEPTALTTTPVRAPSAAPTALSGTPVRTPSAAPVAPSGTPSAKTGAPPATTSGASIPLKDAVQSMSPQDVWQNFYDVSQVPRSSHNEAKIRDFLVQFGKNLGLDTTVDAAGNVLIRKQAAADMEKRAGVVLQAHMDMVAQVAPGGSHDFGKDPIQAFVSGDWVKANGTTLGADDGIGLAMIMAVLQSRTLVAGPIEALFTVNEEDGMDGANGLKPDILKGKMLINLDSETEGEFTIGSAGGQYTNVSLAYAETAVPSGSTAYTLTVQGLKGGHSGVDINLGRGHATKLLVRFLKDASQKDKLRVAQIAGGTAANAIPRDAFAIVVVPQAQSGAFLTHVHDFEAIVKKELAAVEPGLAVTAVPASVPKKVMDAKAQATIINALYGSAQGVIRMSDAVPGLVETSTNMGIVSVQGGQVSVAFLMRSSVDSALDDVTAMVASIWELAGGKVVLGGRYAGWPPNPGSELVNLMQTVYKDLYGTDATVSAVHAGLECSAIGAKYPDMDMISIGPMLQNVHSPDEALQVSSVAKAMDLLAETLRRMPDL